MIFTKATREKHQMNKIDLSPINNTNKAHRDNLRNILKRRIEAARNQGNNKLVQQLQEEANYLNL